MCVRLFVYGSDSLSGLGPPAVHGRSGGDVNRSTYFDEFWEFGRVSKGFTEPNKVLKVDTS